MFKKSNKVISSIMLALVMSASTVYSTISVAAPYFATTADATAAATKLGYAKTSELSNGQAVYKRGNDYISRDIDGHNGGAWKRASAVADLSVKGKRIGTFNADLTKRIGD